MYTNTHHQWTRDSFIVSTNPSLISIAALNEAFSSDLLYWAKPLTEEEYKVMLDHSICFMLFSPARSQPEEKPAMIGMARLVTDRVTFAYLTDVYVQTQWQHRGLGTWLLECVREWIEQMPNMRRFLLITGEGKQEEYYARTLGTGRTEDEGNGQRVFSVRGRGIQKGS